MANTLYSSTSHAVSLTIPTGPHTMTHIARSWRMARHGLTRACRRWMADNAFALSEALAGQKPMFLGRF